MLIRPATLDDAQAVAHVHVEAWRTAYRGILPDAYLDGLSVEARSDMWQVTLAKDAPNEIAFVAEVDGRVVGFASGGPERKGDPDFTGELYAIYMLDEHRGRGIGSALFKSVVEQLLALGVNSMKVWVLRDNLYRGFYERHGGVLVGQETIRIADLDLIEVAYGWSQLEATSASSSATAGHFPRPTPN